MAKPWDGKGVAPSKEAARQWAISQGVNPKDMAYSWTDSQNKSGTASSWSDAARELVAATPKQAQAPASQAPAGNSQISPPASNAATQSGTPATPKTLQELIAEGPQATANNGYPLLPYSNLSGAVIANLPTKTTVPGATNPDMYTEGNLLDPRGWSQEKIADMQQQMMNVGLYGNQKTVKGYWQNQDLEAYRLLLTGANVSGRTKEQQLAEWSIRPPTPVDIKGLGGSSSSGSKGVVQLTNPTDIRSNAETVSQNLIGHVDPGFVNAAPAAYNAQEQAAGDAQIADVSAGNGGTVTQAPSQQAFLEDKLQREQPLAVDANSFIGTFDNFRKMLGAQR